MTQMVRWDPFAEITGLRRAMDRAFDDFLPLRAWRNAETASELTFPVDLYENEDHVVVKAALPGISPDDVDISVSEGVLTVKGESKHEERTERDNYYRQELRYGSFSRSIPMPTRVDHEKAEAEFKDGLLIVTLPKVEEVRPKQIKVKTATPELASTASRN